MTLSDAKKRKLGDKYDPESLFLETYDYSVWSENKEEATDKEDSEDLSDMPPLEGDEEEVRGGKVNVQGINIATPNKLLTRLPLLLAQIKARNNSYKLEIEIRKILYLLYQHNRIMKNVYNNLYICT